MKFAILGHLIDEEHIKQIPKSWIKDNLIVSPEFNLNKTKGHILGLKSTAQQMMTTPKEDIRTYVEDAILFAEEKLDVEIVQLGALTTSVTTGGKWLIENKKLNCYLNHGDSYTSAITCQAVNKAIEKRKLISDELIISIVGAYGIIGEAVSKILVPKFKKSILVGRQENKFKKLVSKLDGNFEITTELNTNEADVIVTATSHPTALLEQKHLKKKAIVVDVSQPPNLSEEVCKKRPDIVRIDGGYVNNPIKYNFPIPGMPKNKCYSCMAEVIMQAMENEKRNHIGSIDINHLKKTEKWGEKYGFILKDLTNFGKSIKNEGE